MKRIFELPEVNAFEFSPADAIMLSGEGNNNFAVDKPGTTVPTINVTDPAIDGNDWE